jgi:hypothetical protein
MERILDRAISKAIRLREIRKMAASKIHDVLLSMEPPSFPRIFSFSFPMVTSQESMTKGSNRRFMINIIRTRIKKQDRAMGPCLVMECLKTDLNLELS